MSLDFFLDSPFVGALSRSLDLFLFCLWLALFARFRGNYSIKLPRLRGASRERGDGKEARARRFPRKVFVLLALFLARVFSPLRNGLKYLRQILTAWGEGKSPGGGPVRRAAAFPPPLSLSRGLSPDGASGVASYRRGALLSGGVTPLKLGAPGLEASALSIPRREALVPRAFAWGDSPAIGAPLTPKRSGSESAVGEARARSLPAHGEEGDSVPGGAELPRLAQGDSPRLGSRGAFLESKGASPFAGIFSLPAETELRELVLVSGGDFPPTPLPARAGENLFPAEAPPNIVPDQEKRPAPLLSLASPEAAETRTASTLLGLIRGRLARAGVDLGNLSLSPLKMAGAQTGQALLGLVRRAAFERDAPIVKEEETPELTSPPPLEDFKAARLLWEKLQKESAFWSAVKESPALSSWREGFSPEEIEAAFAGLESLALEKMEREYALARKLHPRFLLASDPARAEERLTLQEKAARILGGRGGSFTLFPTLDGGTSPRLDAVLASVRLAAAARPESPEESGGRVVLFMEANGEAPLGYLALGPAPVDQKRILGEIGRFSQERGRVKVLLAGAEYFDVRKKLLVKEAPVSQKDGWMEGSLRARLAKGSLNAFDGAAIALPARSPDQGRLVAFHSPGAGKERQTALRDALSLVLKEAKRFWGENADAKARASFQATIRRGRRRTGLKVLESLFEESRAPGGELIWKIAAEKRALAETAFDFTVLRTTARAKIIPDAELCRLYRRHQKISREIAAFSGPLHLELWLKFFRESWRASPAAAPGKELDAPESPRGENSPQGEGERAETAHGLPRANSPGGSFLQERLYELLASQKPGEERPALAS